MSKAAFTIAKVAAVALPHQPATLTIGEGRTNGWKFQEATS